MPTDLAIKIRRIRLALDKTKPYLADVLDISLRTYNNYENGIHVFKVEHLDRMAAYFKVTTGQLIDLSYEELIHIIIPARGGGRNPELKNVSAPTASARRSR